MEWDEHRLWGKADTRSAPALPPGAGRPEALGSHVASEPQVPIHEIAPLPSLHDVSGVLFSSAKVCFLHLFLACVLALVPDAEGRGHWCHVKWSPTDS